MISSTISLLITSLFVSTTPTSLSNLFNSPSNSSWLSPQILPSLIYSQNSTQIISVNENNPITSIDIYDNMIIAMDIKINQIYIGHSQSIFHIGNKHSENYPSILLNKNPENGFRIRMINNLIPSGYQIFKTYNNIKLNTNYHIEISYNQHSFSVYLNGEPLISDNDFPAHLLCANTNVYVGDPWHQSANAYITNLKIFGWNVINTNVNVNNAEQHESSFFWETLYKKYLSSSWHWGILAGVVLICNIGILWYLNCLSYSKYKKETKTKTHNSCARAYVARSDIINLKIKKMQQAAAHELVFSSDDDVAIAYDDGKPYVV